MKKILLDIRAIFSRPYAVVKNRIRWVWAIFEDDIIRAWATVFWHSVIYLFSLFMVVRWISNSPAAKEDANEVNFTLVWAENFLHPARQFDEHVKINFLDEILKVYLQLIKSEDYTEVKLVIAVSFLWFFAFLTANSLKSALNLKWHLAHSSTQDKRPPLFVSVASYVFKKSLIVVATILAVKVFLFIKPMHEPAIFVMALIAIFIAAEHYGGLRESEDKLEEKTDEINNEIGRALNADGMEKWRAEIYNLYGKSIFRVDAVMRYFEIDSEWWKCGGESNSWAGYDNLSRKNPDSLLAALRKCEAKVQFVADFPLPDFDESKDSLGNIKIERGDFFRNFLGLAWYLIVFEIVNYEKNNSDFFSYSKKYMRIKIGNAPSWMHVIDQTVYQVIERGLPDNSTVRNLTRSVPGDIARKNLSDWARRNVRQFADRGGIAEEYVFSVFRYFGLRFFNENQTFDAMTFNDETYIMMLNKLGMNEFLEMPKLEFILEEHVHVGYINVRNKLLVLKRADAEKLCLSIFKEFLTRRSKQGIFVMSGGGSNGAITLNKLLYEVV